MKKILVSILAGASLMASALVPSAAAAGSASFSLSPASGTYAQNSSFTVTVRENGTNVNAVTAKLTYDAAKLSCTGVSTATSDFAASSGANCSGGNVTIGRYVGLDDATGNPNPAKNGSQVVGTITFKALVATGSTSVAFAAGSQIASDGVDTWNGVTTGGTYSFTAAPTPPSQPSNPAPTGGNNTPAPTTSNPSTNNSKKTTSTSTSSAQTTAPAETPAVASETTDKPATKSDAAVSVSSQKNDSKDSSNGVVWALVSALAVLAGLIVYRQKSRKMVAAPVAASKPAKKAPKAAPAKTTKKKTSKR